MEGGDSVGVCGVVVVEVLDGVAGLGECGLGEERGGEGQEDEMVVD